MLLKTGIELELMTDIDMYQMVEKGLRGGLSQVSRKHMKANNKYMESFDEDVMSSFLMYLDANNLYGVAMSANLPYAGLKWSSDMRNSEDILIYNPNSDHGYFLEYPDHLHDLHSDYPLAPERKSISADMVSDFSKQVHKEYYGSEVKDEKHKKIITSFNKKTNYVCHIRNVKYYLEQGLVLSEVHRCIKFKQKEWLKEWIDFNTEKGRMLPMNFTRTCIN